MTFLEWFWKTRLVAAGFEGAQATRWWQDLYLELLAAADSPAAQAALDVGCGEGLGTRVLAAHFLRVTGVDISEHMVRRARRHARDQGVANVDYRTANACCLPFDDNSFDLVTSTSLVYFLPDPAGALAEMGRVCRPGGRIACFDPSPRLTFPRTLKNIFQGEVRGRGRARAVFFLLGWVVSSGLNRRFSITDMQRLLAQAGLKPRVLEMRHDGMILFTISSPRKTA